MINANIYSFCPHISPFPFSPPLWYILAFLLAAGQPPRLVQDVDEGHQEQEQQNTHHHGYHHPAGASLLLFSYSAVMVGHMERDMEGWAGGWRVGGRKVWRVSEGLIREEEWERRWREREVFFLFKGQREGEPSGV